jgi:hypothetical protein
MKQACPISIETVDENVVRSNAALTVLSLIIFLFTPYKWIVFVLGADFVIRGFLNKKYSFYGAISKAIVSVFNAKAAPTNAGPKIFSAKIGTLFCGLLIICGILNLQSVIFVIGVIFMFFAFLEAAFGFCLACRIYPFIYKG